MVEIDLNAPMTSNKVGEGVAPPVGARPTPPGFVVMFPVVGEGLAPPVGAGVTPPGGAGPTPPGFVVMFPLVGEGLAPPAWPTKARTPCKWLGMITNSSKTNLEKRSGRAIHSERTISPAGLRTMLSPWIEPKRGRFPAEQIVTK